MAEYRLLGESFCTLQHLCWIYARSINYCLLIICLIISVYFLKKYLNLENVPHEVLSQVIKFALLFPLT